MGWQMKLVSVGCALAALCFAGAFASPTLAAQTNAPHVLAAMPPAGGAKGTVLLVYKGLNNTIVFKKGVAAVSNPSTGIYCVTTTVPLPAGALPVVTVEWGNSVGNSLLAYWVDSVFDCPAGQIDIRTYDFSSGAPVLSHNVAFTVFVE